MLYIAVKRQNQGRMQHQPRNVIGSKKKSAADSFRLPPLNLNRINATNANYKSRRNGISVSRETSLLGDLHVDKLYLQKLLENPGIQ